MPINAPDEHAFETYLFRCATDTIKSIQNLDMLPKYVHKWTKQSRNYTIDDLSVPPELFLRGNKLLNGRIFVAVGGTRSPSVETFTLVTDVIRTLSGFGAVILSGAVPGVDLAAHMAASESGMTYGVLANPVSHGLSGHEWSNAWLQKLILNKGGFISEHEAWVPVLSDVFRERLLQRDRLISGLSDVFLAFECRENSATVDTAKRALLQGKLVVVVDSERRTVRVGTEQLLDEFNFKHFSSDILSGSEIGEAIWRLASNCVDQD